MFSVLAMQFQSVGRAAATLLLAIVPLAGQSIEALLQKAEERIQKEDLAAAEAILQQAVRQHPGNVQLLYRLGYAQYRLRKLPQARTQFTAVVKTAPPAYHSRYFLGRIALLENKAKEAVEWLEPVVASGENVQDSASQLAAALARSGQPARAVGPLQAAIAATPWDASLYYRLGQIYRQTGQNEMAREAMANSARLNKASREDVEVLMQISQAVGSGKSGEARELASRITNKPQADPNALVALGVIYGSANLPEDAIQVFDRAAQLDPSLFAAQFNRGLALMKIGRPADALPSLSEAVKLLPQSFDANVTQGLASVMTQQYGNAIPPLERAWQMNSSNARVGSLLATAYLRTGSAAKAVPVLQKASAGAADPTSLLLLVEALNATEDTNGALDAARLAQSRFPKVSRTHLAVAQQLTRLGKYQDARPAFEQTLQLEPGQPEAELGLADTLQRAGEHEAAIPHYEAALRATSTTLAARVGMARSLAAARKLAEARKVLEDGIATYPTELSLRVELARVYARLGETALSAEQTKVIEQLRSQSR